MPEKILTLRYLSITSYMKSKAQLIILHPVVKYVNMKHKKGNKEYLVENNSIKSKRAERRGKNAVFSKTVSYCLEISISNSHPDYLAIYFCKCRNYEGYRT